MQILPSTSPATPAKPSASPSALTPEKDAKLHKAAKQMEGTFVQQMYKAMRETVPDDGAFNGGSGEEMFTGLLDEHVATDTPSQWHHGLSEAIYRQMRNAVLTQAHEATSPETPATLPAQMPLQGSQQGIPLSKPDVASQSLSLAASVVAPQ